MTIDSFLCHSSAFSYTKLSSNRNQDLFSILELYNLMFTPRVHAGKWQTYRIKIEKTTRFSFEHLTHAWKIHSRGFYSNSRWNAPVPGFKWKHCIHVYLLWNAVFFASQNNRSTNEWIETGLIKTESQSFFYSSFKIDLSRNWRQT